jgi:hypothetical protein
LPMKKKSEESQEKERLSYFFLRLKFHFKS